MHIFILRATTKESYDCPDYGPTHICDRYEDILFATDRTKLDEMAAELNKGIVGQYWSASRAKQLRELHNNFDDFADCAYGVIEVFVETK